MPPSEMRPASEIGKSGHCDLCHVESESLPPIGVSLYDDGCCCCYVHKKHGGGFTDKIKSREED